MSFLQAFTSLPPKTRALIGASFLVWGTAGLYLTDTTENKLGFEATEEDRNALNAAVPKITWVEREAGK